MRETNPFEAPASLPSNIREGHTQASWSSDVGPWRDEEMFVARIGAELPDRCVICNAPAHGVRQRHRLRQMQHWLLYRLLRLPILFFEWGLFFVYAIIRWRRPPIYELEYGICRHHQSQSRTMLWTGLVCMFTGAATLVAWEAERLEVSGLLFFGGYLMATILRAPFTLVSFDGEYVWLAKVNPGYLNQLPTFSGMR